ncbi:double-stranded RNA-binding protein 2-like [Phragmites australis]|uniref:double-stranded RNA-binding protein 2-like n=1 Tax=Phragmites australis TaxID=29695 RepID=UPI002D76DB97|nr:double-stranded RNA-binding protein 2-like [Phragmites australis]XP_062230770.1 double-stranded RNA-binding protein 2-like [Phragmites australis]
MYKNQLQELAQRSCFNLPSYACIREGPDHAPRFKATVNFNGETFESTAFCSTLRQAEHAAAEVALNELSKRGPSSTLAAKVLDETGIYKNLLQETAHRAGLKLPVYTTIRSGPGHTPVFTCTVELAGMTFTGNPCKTKKQAQKNAAMAAWSELKQLPRVGEPSSSSCPPDQDDEEQEQVLVTRALASLNQANDGKMLHQKEKQQSNNRPSSRRSYPKPNMSSYRSHLHNQPYPSIPPEQAMYHMWHRVQATQPTPHFSVVPTMGSTRFPPTAAMLSMYPPPRGQFASLANQDSLGLLPCFPEAAPALPRYFPPYPVSYMPRSPLLATVNRNNGKRQECTETVKLLDAAVFSQYTSSDSSSTTEYGRTRKVQEPPKNREEDCTMSSASPEEENKSPLTVSSSTTHASSQKLEPNEDKETLGSNQAEAKKPQEQQPKSSQSWVSPSVPPCGPIQRKHYTSSVQHGELIHRNNPPQTGLPALPELWSSGLQAPSRFGTAVPVNSPGSVYQQQPPWLAAPVTVRTAVPVCSARPNVVNTTASAAQIRPVVQSRSTPAREVSQNLTGITGTETRTALQQ